MRQQRDIYFKRHLAYKHEQKRLEEDKISQNNKELIRRWVQHLFATGSKEIRVAKVSSQIRRLGHLADFSTSAA